MKPSVLHGPNENTRTCVYFLNYGRSSLSLKDLRVLYFEIGSYIADSGRMKIFYTESWFYGIGPGSCSLIKF